jgi:hypothetical protein
MLEKYELIRGRTRYRVIQSCGIVFKETVGEIWSRFFRFVTVSEWRLWRWCCFVLLRSLERESLLRVGGSAGSWSKGNRLGQVLQVPTIRLENDSESTTTLKWRLKKCCEKRIYFFCQSKELGWNFMWKNYFRFVRICSHNNKSDINLKPFFLTRKRLRIFKKFLSFSVPNELPNKFFLVLY